MATIVNKRDLLLQATTPRLLSINTNYVTAIPSNSTVYSTVSGDTLPSTVTVIASLSGILTGTVTWSAVPSIPLSISSNSVDIDGADIPEGTSVDITASLLFLGETYESTVTITHSPDIPSYRIVPSTTNVVNEGSGVFSPPTVLFSSKSSVLGELSNYSGRFIVTVSLNGTTFSTLYTSSSDEASYIYTPNASHKLIRVRLYQAGGTSKLLDDVTISVSPSSTTDLSDTLSKSSANVLTGTIVPLDSGGIKVGTITWNSTTGALTGGTGIALTEWGIVGAASGSPKFSIEAATGNATFSGVLSAATGTFAGNLSAAGGTFTGTLSGVNGTFSGTLSSATGTFTGDITGAASINITGSGLFNGSTSFGGYSAGIQANTSKSQIYGIIGWSGNSILGIGVVGVAGTTSGSVGIAGTASGSGRIAVRAENTTGTALFVRGNITQETTGTTTLRSVNINSGGLTVSSGSTSVGSLSCSSFSTSSTSLVTNLNSQYWNGQRINGPSLTGSSTATFIGTNKPGSSSSNRWLRITDTGGTHAYIPVWT